MAHDQFNNRNNNGRPNPPRLNVHPQLLTQGYVGVHGPRNPHPFSPYSPQNQFPSRGPLAQYPPPPSQFHPQHQRPRGLPTPRPLPSQFHHNMPYRTPTSPLPQNHIIRPTPRRAPTIPQQNLYGPIPQRGPPSPQIVGSSFPEPQQYLISPVTPDTPVSIPAYSRVPNNRRDYHNQQLSPASYFESNDSQNSSRIDSPNQESYELMDYYNDNNSDTSAEAYPAHEEIQFNHQDFNRNGLDSNSQNHAWNSDNHQIPVSKEGIEDIFIDLTDKFGFQKESMRNMFDHLMCMLDSRASRMTPSQALITLHADYIGGVNANYRKWYFIAKMDLDDALSNSNAGKGIPMIDSKSDTQDQWIQRMNSISQHERVRQLALWLLLWGEASQVRFMGECLCFIFKLANDYYNSSECKSNVPEGEYLRNVITPLYLYIRNQSYEVISGKFVKKEKDHAETIGYDDINQLFWYPEMIDRITLQDKQLSIMSLPRGQRYLMLGKVNWNRVFVKTYKEKRTWFHLAVNFTRIWIIHVAVFWYYTAYNAPFLYKDDNDDEPAVQWSVVALGGAISTLFMIVGNICEFFFIPLTGSNLSMLIRRFIFLFIVLIINSAPTYYIIVKARTGPLSLKIAMGQLFISLVTTLTFAIVPSARLFGGPSKGSQKYEALHAFTSNYAPLNKKDRAVSIGLWCCVFGFKLVESYFFLSLSFKDPLEAMFKMRVIGCGDKLAGSTICSFVPVLAIVIMFLMDLVLFFLDTYLWYIIWNTIFSVVYALTHGSSIWTPWNNVFAKIPERIYAKILASNNIDVKYHPKDIVAQIWNAIMIAMYREHILSFENVQALLYQRDEASFKPPTVFAGRNDNEQYYSSMSEAERRITFFAQSLSNPIPSPLPVQNMPTFTVLTPHYSEKILLSLREIIREEDQNTRVTLLEYLKQLYPVEWDNFVKDTKNLVEKSNPDKLNDSGKGENKKVDDLPFYMIGFKSSSPQYSLRTRIWSSLRTQTLYRTISGFMNYSKAIKLLYRVENPNIVTSCENNPEKFENEMALMVRRKFKFLISMQRYNKFNKEEQENADFLLSAYPDLQIAYLDEIPPENEGEEPKIFSVLIDGHCEKLPDGKRKPRYRVRLPGNPILGDGKSDNQNHAIIFYRGEYLQLVDANQDNYLEECLKIRNVLGEFEQYDMSTASPYSSAAEKSPIAIVGAREYIYSENYGVLGDVAAGKEQTFGTLTQRIMAKVGGRLHYGHPDFLNAIFMTTRGGISKAQKGLHLNEDIYAGMNAFNRGGRIKHSEYIQCGKGRDLGFGSILHFTTKIGTGMGEQMLSREYYYIGTQLSLDRFLTFYYAHPGFHVNNILIMLSIQLFMFGMMFIGAMRSVLPICERDTPQGVFCYDLIPITDWIKRSIISIIFVFFVAFLPLFMQESGEKGLLRGAVRLGKHFMSLSPFFEVFTTQIYANSIMTNLSFGGARYIATGRGFATARLPFSILFSRFAGSSIYFGMKILLILLFVSLTMWIPHLIYFWVSVIALCISPFLFNPHQFSFSEFIIDYREFLRWMSRGNSKTHGNSWISYCRISRTMITGFKRKRLGHPSEKLVGDVPRPSFSVIFVSEVLTPFILAALCIVAFMFVKSFDPVTPGLPNTGPSAVIRVCAIAVGPMLMNAMMLAGLFVLSFCLGPAFDKWFKFGAVIAAIAHTWAIINLIGAFELLWFIESWKLENAILGMIALGAIQRFVFKLMISLFLSREFKHDETNRAWWTGKWQGKGLGLSTVTREYICKIVEMSLFAADFILGHLLLFMLAPFCLIPWIDKLHSIMLFWLRPSKQIRPPIFSRKQKKRRNRIVWTYGLLFIIIFMIFAGLIAGPIMMKDLEERRLKLEKTEEVWKEQVLTLQKLLFEEGLVGVDERALKDLKRDFAEITMNTLERYMKRARFSSETSFSSKTFLPQRVRNGKFRNLPSEDDEEEVYQERFIKECSALPGSMIIVHDTSRFPLLHTRKPDCVGIAKNRAIDPLNVLFVVEITKHTNNAGFNNNKVDQTIAFANKVLEIQYRRRSVYAILTDYYNIQFFKVERQEENHLHFIYTYTTSESLYYDSEEPPLGWQRLVTFLCQVPSELGWLESELKIDDVRIRLERYLGVGRTGVVYEDEPVVVKVLKRDYKHHLNREITALKSFADLKCKNHLPSLIKYNDNAIVITPVCEKINHWRKTDIKEVILTLEEIPNRNSS
ncbi:17595_t:CDS:2 [Funneliformis caledonium]|uniref:1,3-beta-glucan synthase n=1 Tax=Funneliformis caledonium TaxID=1117310 RepID=A0A9N9F1K7_9GLOM|nr:17595_t:CDS:2 [Funneliformis caledonium]